MSKRRNKPPKPWEPERKIAFSLSSFAFGDEKARVPTVDVSVDGRSVWLAWTGEPPEGGVPGLSPQSVALPSRHWLGQPLPDLQDDGRAVVFNCGCGSWQCGAVLARIAVTDEEVRWTEVGFVGQTDALDSFLFDRAQYEGALSAISQL